MKGKRNSRPTVGITRSAWVSPTGRKLETPGWFEIEASIASARTLANGVQISPAESVNDRRHCASAVSRVYVPGMPRSRHCDGNRPSGSADARTQRPLGLASVVIGSKAAGLRVRLVELVF